LRLLRFEAILINLDRGVVGPGIHNNGFILPWHRYLVWQFESVLINECDYTGSGVPYWDWTLDNPEYGRRFEDSPVFDPKYGFGGNGKGGSVPAPPPQTMNMSALPPGNCVGDGPLVGLESNVGPGYSLEVKQPHCIVRNFNSTFADMTLGWTKNVVPLLQEGTFTNFTNAFNLPKNTGVPVGVHGAGHGAVYGEMGNTWSSVNDPLFFLHHAQIDRLWWIWQNLKPQNEWAIGGTVYPNGTGTVSLNSPIYFSPAVAPDVNFRYVMDTRNRNGRGVLCYVYDYDNRTKTL
jgi:tyrosinase